MMQADNNKGTDGVSLVATVFNEGDSIAGFARSIRSQTRRPDEVVIVDGGSTDGTPEAIGRELDDAVTLRLIVEPGCNISEGRNRAIAEARHELIACSDAGCVLRDDWLEKIVGPLERDESIDVVSGFYELECHNLLQRCVGLLTMPGQLDPPDPERFLPSARSIAFRREAWRAAGGYPEWLYTGEDTLFDIKLKRMGYRFRFAGDALVAWEPRPTLRKVARQFFLYARGGGQLNWNRDALVWEIRQLLVVAAIVVGGVFWWPVFLLLPFWFAYQHLVAIHPSARRIARRCGTSRAYWMTGLLYWVIRYSRLAGTVRGLWQRWRRPEIFVSRYETYMDEAPARSPQSELPKGI